MLRFEERDDVTVQNPPAGEVVLFYTDGAFRIKDSAGEVTTITTVEGLEEVAEATEPKVYVALLTQTGTDARVATVLKNTLGGVPVWSYVQLGYYRCTGTNLFTVDKTTVVITIGYSYEGDLGYCFYGNFTNNDSFDINSFTDGVAADSVLEKATIEIKVYP